jgi:hypothetical protein
MTKAQKTFGMISSQIRRFTCPENAFSFAGKHSMRVMMGDDMKFWVATPKNCAILEKMGYDYAD